MQRFSNASFGRTLLGYNFGGLLLEQTFCWHCAAFPWRDPELFGRVRSLVRFPPPIQGADNHHPDSKKRKSSEENSGSIHPYGRYGNAGKTSKTISTIAILWPVKDIFEKRAATVEVDSFVSPAIRFAPPHIMAQPSTHTLLPTQL